MIKQSSNEHQDAKREKSPGIVSVMSGGDHEVTCRYPAGHWQSPFDAFSAILFYIINQKSDTERTQTVWEFYMKKEYDFSDSVRNPDAKHIKKQVSLRLNKETIAYFKAMAIETGIPYQNLINLYLTECAHSGKKLTLKWAS